MQISAQKQKKQTSLKNSKESYITFKIAEFNLDRQLVDTAPDTLIGSTLHLPAIDIYCDSLISLLGKRSHPQWAGQINNPFLATFPSVADQTDIMDGIKLLWGEVSKKMTKQERKDDQLVRNRFMATYLELAIPAMGSTCLGKPFDWLKINQPEMELRKKELNIMMETLRKNQSPFTLTNIKFKPMEAKEYILDLMAPNVFTYVC